MKVLSSRHPTIKKSAITLLFSLVVGFLAALWRFKLDPEGTGGSILALPVIMTLFPLCITLLLVGLLTLNKSYGPFLVAASFLAFISFYVLNGLLVP